MEIVDPKDSFADAKAALEEQRALLNKRLDQIRVERETACAKWAEETKQIKELLRVKAPYTRKPKAESAA
ncbi:MAG: hypothetical protein PHS14_17325 [Elusimicrobia bacterium]|nr:hypothetical protein [Elusimicrobiota bacterium]